MDFSNRNNRPAPQGPQQQTPVAVNGGTPTKRMSLRGDNGPMLTRVGSIVLLFGIALLTVAMVVALVFGTSEDKQNLESTLINRDQYQAVFLDSQDGQVYFGKMAIYNDDLYILNDIFYVRVENPIQPQGTEPQQPNISLAKLGNELHGPEDVMFIARDKVLYWENLKDEGQVVTAINNFKASGNEVPAAAPAAPAEETPAGDAGADAAGTQPTGTPPQNDTPAAPPATPAPAGDNLPQ